MNSKQQHLTGAELFLSDRLKLTTHKHRYCPFCHGKVCRERRKGFLKLTILFGIRLYRCESCDRLHYGFCF
jgi:hypothetical protein